MNLFRKQDTKTAVPGSDMADFDLLRARLEVDLKRPAVIAITSSTPGDGKDIAARRLASSLAMTGYATLLVDASASTSTRTRSYQGLPLEEMTRQLISDPGSSSLVNLNLSDVQLQRTTGQKNVEVAFEMLRSKFDYVVIDTEQSIATSFATSIVAASDAVLVTVKQGRRLETSDSRLSETLGRLESRFLGVISLDASVLIEGVRTAPTSDTIPLWRAGQPHDKEIQRREIAESAS